MSELDDVKRRFADLGRAVLLPSVTERDRAARFDRSLWRELAASGLFRVRGLARRAAAVEGLAYGSTDLGVSVSVCAHLVVISVLEQFGSDEQRARFLPKLHDGSSVGACANAEPGAGTDIMGLKSRATPPPPPPPSSARSGWLLTARKASVTNLGVADVVLLSARVEGVDAQRAVNVFAVDTNGTDRLWMRRREDLAGLRTSPTGSLIARKAPLPSSSLVGALGSGLTMFRAMFSEERLTTGALYLGALRACLERALAHAERRRQFGQAIGKNQYVQDKIVRMRVAAELLDAQLERTGARIEAGAAADDHRHHQREMHDVHASLSVVKVHGIDAAIGGAQDLVRLLGSRGVSNEEHAERLLRDLLALSILGGTVELQKIVIYNELTRARAAAPTTAPTAGSAPAAATAAPAALDVSAVPSVDEGLARELVDVVRHVYASEPSLRGRWFYDTQPDLVITARRGGAGGAGGGGAVAGFRTVVFRTTTLGARDITLAGVGAAVVSGAGDDDVYRALTERAFALARERGVDVVVTFLLPAQREDRLRAAGFDRLKARVTYLERSSGALVEERMPCYVKELGGGALVDEIEARGALHLGVGTW